MDYFTIVELIKYFDLNNSMLVPSNSFVYAAKMRTDTILDSYFTTLYGATDDTGKETLNIKGIIVNYVNHYDMQTSKVDCEDNEESFYFDIANQKLYIHLNHSLNPYSCLIEYGKVYGFTNDKIRNFNGINYLPLVKSIPNFSIKVDPLRYGRQSFFGGDIVFNNNPIDGSNDGPFDSNEEFTGNDIFIYYGEDGDAYTDLFLVANNYIENTKPSMQEIVVITKDKREQQTISIPTETFTLADYPDIDSDLVDEIKPDAYGLLNYVPGICINSNNAGNKTFYFASIINYPLHATPVPAFEVYEDEQWISIATASTDYPNGTCTFAVADIHVDGDNTKGIKKVRCVSAYYRNYLDPADQIVELNNRYLGIPFNSSNYNITEWNAEKAYLSDTGLYLNEQKELYEWIEILQNGSTVGFQYFFDNGKRTIRLDNPNRTAVKTIYAVEILNEPNFDNNEQFFSTHAKIEYNKNQESGKTQYIENTDYYNDVIKQHRKESRYEAEVLNINQSIAEDKAVIIMEDQQKERPIGKLLFCGKDFFSLRLFDIINAQISNPGQVIGKESVDIYQASASLILDLDEYRASSTPYDRDVYIAVDWTQRDIVIGNREFLGWMRFQIIGLFPDFENGNIEIEVRQRDYSDEYERITGYTP